MPKVSKAKGGYKVMGNGEVHKSKKAAKKASSREYAKRRKMK